MGVGTEMRLYAKYQLAVNSVCECAAVLSSMALFEDGKLVFYLHRSEIESRQAPQIAEVAFQRFRQVLPSQVSHPLTQPTPCESARGAVALISYVDFRATPGLMTSPYLPPRY